MKKLLRIYRYTKLQILSAVSAHHKIDVHIECAKYIKFPTNSVDFKAVSKSEVHEGFVYKYVWELKRSTLLDDPDGKNDDERGIIDLAREHCTWHLSNLKEGRYIYKVTGTSTYPNSRASN